MSHPLSTQISEAGRSSNKENILAKTWKFERDERLVVWLVVHLSFTLTLLIINSSDLFMFYSIAEVKPTKPNYFVLKTCAGCTKCVNWKIWYGFRMQSSRRKTLEICRLMENWERQREWIAPVRWNEWGKIEASGR